MSKLVLGLDLGPNSIGWALVNDDPENPDDCKLVDLGVRIFPEGVDAFDTSKEKSRNEDRRVARGMRRQTLRRARRRRQLKDALIEAGLWPAGSAAQAELYHLDPYALRARALEEKLSPHEIGRILLHLNQRRGFKSNKKEEAKADAKAKRKTPKKPEKPKQVVEKKTEDILLEMSELANAIKQSGARSLGEYLHFKYESLSHIKRIEDDHIRGRHTQRKMLMNEFNLIWDEQAKHYPDLLTDKLRYGKLGRQKDIRRPLPRHREFLDKDGMVKNPRNDMTDLEAFGLFGIVFFHRTLKPVPKEVRGLCELEPKQRRCARADRRAQRFRLLQEINNLRYIDPEHHKESSLNDGQRAMLLEFLATREKATFDQIRDKLGFLDTVRFNLEKGKRSSIKGMVSDWLMAKSLGKDWHKLKENIKDDVIEALVETVDDVETHEQLTEKYAFSSEQADLALGVDLPDGYIHISLVAIKKLLPHMERGLLYMAEDQSNSALHAAGYLRRDQLQRRIFDKLPDPARTRDCPIGDIPNPVVKRTLTEVRRVVNAIIREHGKPDAVHIEMAREVQLGKTKRDERSKQMRDREAVREKAANKLQENGVRVTRDNILKYMLWEQQGNECIYSGEPISFEKLFGEAGGVEVDHILPRSRTLDDSQMNKVVCLRTSNADKGDQTPYEWLADTDHDRYDQICQQASKLMKLGKMPYPKYRRFIQKELDLDKFIARQLTDTSYITRATAEYLRCLFEQDHDVLGLKGQLTAELRWHWGLETVLQELPDSPGWQDEKAGKLRPGEKNRADHRHHAVDAVVVALTNRSRLQQLSRIVKQGGARVHGEILFDPWPHFRDDVKSRIAEVNVSHRVERKVRGALHEDTLYGPTETDGEWVVRKPLVDLSPAEIERIRDKAIRELVEGTLQAHGVEFGRGKKPDKKKMKEVLSRLTMPSGVPIKKVRIIKPELTIRPVRQGQPGEAYVKPGSTHHLCIFQWEEGGKTKRDAVFVTMLEATERLKRQQQELAPLRKELTKEGLTGKKLKQALAKHASRIARQYPLIQRDASKLQGEASRRIPKDAKFAMSLSSREMVLVDLNGEHKLLTFRTSISTEKRIKFAEHTDARKSYKLFDKTVNSLINSLGARKVTVDPIGRIRWAND